MPITILDYIKTVVGEKDAYTDDDFFRHRTGTLGHCECCSVTLRAGNAFPCTSGRWRCADCIDDTGFVTVADFITHTAAAACPACGNTNTITQTRIATSEDTDEDALECEDCGEVWQP
jgi:hypothetical protein